MKRRQSLYCRTGIPSLTKDPFSETILSTMIDRVIAHLSIPENCLGCPAKWLLVSLSFTADEAERMRSEYSPGFDSSPYGIENFTFEALDDSSTSTYCLDF